jgi:predicted RNA-binding protein YlxR (DUF448 family)
MLATTADLELDNGPRTEKSAVLRLCAVSRKVKPLDELIRFVVSPHGEVVPDIKRKLPGRGLWLSASRQVVAEAVRRHQFARGFRRDVRVAPTLAVDTERLLARSVVEALAVAAKAGRVVYGFAKVEGLLRAGPRHSGLAALIHASDGAPDGIRKLDALVRQNEGNKRETTEFPIIAAVTSAELDLALSRANVIHAALLAGPASKTFLSRSLFLVRYRLADDDKTAGTVPENSD